MYIEAYRNNMEIALIIIGTVIATVIVLGIIGALLEKPNSEKTEASSNQSSASDTGLEITDILALKALHDHIVDDSCEEKDHTDDDDDDDD